MVASVSERDQPWVLVGAAAVVAVLVAQVVPWYVAVLIAALIVGAGMLYTRSAGRADAPSADMLSSEPSFMRGTGSEEEPFVVRGCRLVPPGGLIQTSEAIMASNLIPGSIVRLEDLNDEVNKGRFKAVPVDRTAPPGLDLKVGLDGRLAFHLVFDDSEHLSLEGEQYHFLGALGKHRVHLAWEVHMKEAREFLEARAAFEANQVRRTGERASIMSRFEAAVAAGMKQEEALAERTAAEDALVEEEKAERLALDELEATTRAAAKETAAEVEEEVAALAEEAEAKRQAEQEKIEAAKALAEAEAEARAEAKALKQAEKALKKAEKQAETTADDGHADDASDEGDEAAVDGLDEEALRADKEERIEREIAEHSAEGAADDKADADDAEAAGDVDESAHTSEDAEGTSEAESDANAEETAEEGAEPEPPAETEAATSDDDAEEEAPSPAEEPEAEDDGDAEGDPSGDAPTASLSDLKGVGPAMLAKLELAGVTSVADLLALDEDGLSSLGEAVGASGKVAGWVEQAKAITEQ
jgi:predicted flap endonuclease-1-like 5' DNA nuclease